MNKLNRVRVNEKGAIQFVILALLLVGIVVGVFLVTGGNPLKLFTRATTPPIVFKAENGSALPKNSNNVPVSSSPNVMVELTSPWGPTGGVSPSAPVSAPNQRRTVSYKIAAEAANLNSATSYPYSTDPTSFLHTFPTSFSTCGSDQKFLWVEFRASDGSIDRRTAQIQISVPCPTPNPSPVGVGTSAPAGGPGGNVGIGTTAPQPRSIKITYPNGGEVFNVGDKVRVTWTSHKIDKVFLAHSFGPGSVNPITGPIPNQDYYDWVVDIGNTANTQVKIDITGYETGVGSEADQSDNFFTVNPQITAPPPPPPAGGSSGGGSSGGGRSQPVVKTISQFRFAESPIEFKDDWQTYYPGIVLSHTFKDANPGTKSILIQFRDENRQIVKINGLDSIQSSIELVEEVQTPPPVKDVPPPPSEEVVVGTASLSTDSTVTQRDGNWGANYINLTLSGFSAPGRSIAGLFVRNQVGECSLSNCGYIGWTQIRSYGTNGTDSNPWTAPSGFSPGIHMFGVFSLNADGTAGQLLDVSATNFTTSSGGFTPPPPPPSISSCQPNITTCSCSDPDPSSSRYPGKCYPECNGGWCNGGICATCQP